MANRSKVNFPTWPMVAILEMSRKKYPLDFLCLSDFLVVIIDTSRILNPKVSFIFQFYSWSMILRASSMRLYTMWCKLMSLINISNKIQYCRKDWNIIKANGKIEQNTAPLCEWFRKITSAFLCVVHANGNSSLYRQILFTNF